jgi:predicted RNA-binding Zn-ribbon protein involved in translation (DUF1610 family)
MKTLIKKCIVCGKEFAKPYTCGMPEWERRKFCSRSCINKGRTPPNKYLKPKKCLNCNKLFQPREKKTKYCCGKCARAKQIFTPNVYRKRADTLIRTNNERRKIYGGSSKPLELRDRIRVMFSGSKSHLWRGGISKLVKLIRQSLKYRTWRTECFIRDNYTCVWCGKHGGRLHCDHIKSFSQILRENNIKTLEEAFNCKELWELSNGRTLCIPCHIQTDTYAKNLKVKGSGG